MSSEHDESTELMEELSVKSDPEKTASPTEKKFQGPGEHAKPKRRGRRGKRRKQRKASGGATSENPEDPENRGSSPPWDSDEDLDCEINAYNDVIIRPINVPKAPENSTQFIIDDHNECRLYMSFETPNPYFRSDNQKVGDKEDIVIEPIGEDAAYRDIDFEYDPPQDFDNSAYYDREFELSYKSNRFDELLRLPRTELISGLRVLETRLKQLSDDLVKVNPSPILEKLQAELLELQEKHLELKECHTSLATRVAQNEVGSTAEGSVGDPQSKLVASDSAKDSIIKNVSNFDEVQGVKQVEYVEVGCPSEVSGKIGENKELSCDNASIETRVHMEIDDEGSRMKSYVKLVSSHDNLLEPSDGRPMNEMAINDDDKPKDVSRVDDVSLSRNEKMESTKTSLDNNPICTNEENKVLPLTDSVSELVNCDNHEPHSKVSEEQEMNSAVLV